MLRTPEVSFAREVIHAGADVHPDDDVTRAFERGRWGMNRRLGPARRREQARHNDEYEV
jgi:hypothetical protein